MKVFGGLHYSHTYGLARQKLICGALCPMALSCTYMNESRHEGRELERLGWCPLVVPGISVDCGRARWCTCDTAFKRSLDEGARIIAGRVRNVTRRQLRRERFG